MLATAGAMRIASLSRLTFGLISSVSGFLWHSLLLALNLARPLAATHGLSTCVATSLVNIAALTTH
jgi:hypothetical protein